MSIADVTVDCAVAHSSGSCRRDRHTRARESRDSRPRARARCAAHGPPENLIASATRLWGDEMDRLWGEMRPVPSHAIVTLAGGERISVGGRDRTSSTRRATRPSRDYFWTATGIAFVGDTAGMKLTESGVILPPTPPPDIDVEAWRRSLDAIDAWQADTLFVTHFGPHAPRLRAHRGDDVASRGWPRISCARRSRMGATDETREAWFTDEIRGVAAPPTLERRRQCV